MASHISAIASVLRHELATQWRDGRARAIVLIALLLLTTSAAVGVQHHATMVAERETANTEEWGRWLNQPPRNPHSAVHYGLGIKPVSPLGQLEPGLDPYLGISTWLEAHWMNDFIHRSAQDATVLSRFPQLDPAQTMQRIIPLVLIFLGFSSFAGERARGTLRQLLSLGMSPIRLALAKWLSTLFWLFLILTPAAALTLASLIHSPDAKEAFLRLSIWALVYLIYLGGWSLLVLATSATARTPRGALAALLGTWLIVCWILPRSTAELVDTLHPLPSSADLRVKLEKALGDLHSSDQALRIRDRILAEYGASRTEDLPIDWRGISLQEGEEANYSVFDDYFKDIFDGYRAQDRLLQYFSFLVPTLAVQTLSQSIAGSDIEHHRDFVFAAEQHRRLMQKLMNENVTLYDREGTDYRADPELWATVPPFEYQRPSLDTILPKQYIAASALLFWIFSTAALAYTQALGAKP